MKTNFSLPTGENNGEAILPMLAEKALTKKEIQVYKHFVINNAKPFKQIASDLGIANNTLGQHLKSIYRKLGVRSKTEAVIKGFNLI
jgi:DNA-binding CsgD family transcriptional regulator